jgi:hypothetical protein
MKTLFENVNVTNIHADEQMNLHVYSPVWIKGDGIEIYGCPVTTMKRFLADNNIAVGVGEEENVYDYVTSLKFLKLDGVMEFNKSRECSNVTLKFLEIGVERIFMNLCYIDVFIKWTSRSQNVYECVFSFSSFFFGF